MGYFLRQCLVCAGTGYLYRTPFEVGGDSSGLDVVDQDVPRLQAVPHGDDLPCWQCLGSGSITDGLNEPLEHTETSIDATPEVLTVKDWATNDGIQQGVTGETPGSL